jgi:anaerobic selenocysteine-containing dehydrogenase
MTHVQARPLTVAGRPSICRMCMNGCAILVDVDDGRLTRVTGDPESPIYRGFSCVKGRAMPAFLSNPDRLLHSQKRDADGHLSPIPSEQAMDEIADRIRGIAGAHGTRAVATYWGTMVGVLALPVINAFMRAFGSPMEFNPTSLDKPGRNIARRIHGEWLAPRQAYDRPDVALLIGVNPLVSFQGAPLGNPGKWFADQLDRGMQLIVVDPRRSDVARRATIHLQPLPGEDAAILASMIHVILAEERYDHAFVDENVSGLPQLRDAVRSFTPAEAARRAGIDADALVRAARIFADGPRGYATVGTGPNMSGPSTLVEYLVLCLESLCGHWLRAGEQVPNPGVLMQPRSMKAQPSAPQPGYGFGVRMHGRDLMESAAGLPTAALPDEMLLDGPERVRALISCGANPVTAWPDQSKTIRALRSLDLLVQIDPWMSQTSNLAHYVIAPKMGLEVPGMSLGHDLVTLSAPTYGCHVPYGQYTPAIVDPPEGSDVIEEWEFFYGVAQRLGLSLDVSTMHGLQLGGASIDMQSKPSSDQLIELLTRGSRIPLSEVKSHPHGAVFSEPPMYVEPREPTCDAHLDVGNADMMADLHLVAAHEMRQGPVADDRIPDREFRLVSRRAMHVYNSSYNDASTNRGRGYNPAFMHPDDLDRLGLAPGDLVEIRSDLSAVAAIVQADANVRQGVVSMSAGFGEAPERDDLQRFGTCVNRLVSADVNFDRYSGQPLMSNVPVDVHSLPEQAEEAKKS